MTEARAIIRSSVLQDAASLRAALNTVAAEQWYLATVTGFTEEQTRAYLQRSIDGHLHHLVAVVGDQIIGACDVNPHAGEGFRHVGQLGMFVLAAWRRQGVGRRLLMGCLSRARSSGLEKVELEVFADNHAAIRLYDSCGFVREGLKQRARRWQGRYQDLLLMARWLEDWQATPPE